MTTLRGFEIERMEFFVAYLFSALEEWIGSLTEEAFFKENTETKPKLPDKRRKLEVLLRSGYMMRVSKLSNIVRANYKRLHEPSKTTQPEQLIEIHLNDKIKKMADSHSDAFTTMGSSIVVTQTPEVTIQISRDGSIAPFVFAIYWVLDAWPDSQITVDFVLDKNKVKVIFHDPNKSHVSREYNENHKNLVLWACLIEYQTVVESHGQCIWPKDGEPRRLEFILPLRPPTEKELDEPLSEWLK